MKAPAYLLGSIVLIVLIFVSTNAFVRTARYAPISGSAERMPVPLLSRTFVDISIGVIVGAALLFLSGSIYELVKSKRLLPGWLLDASNRSTFLVPILLWIGTLVIVLFIAAFFASFIKIDEETQRQAESLRTEITEDTGEEEPEQPLYEERETYVGSENTESRRTVLYVLLVVLLGGSAILAARLLRTSGGKEPKLAEEELDDLREDLYKAGRRGLEALLRGSDHRGAVIAAYAAMEDAFAEYSFKKERYQTPTEYIVETIDAMRAKYGETASYSMPEAALLQLTDLFEIAKFSSHEIRITDRQKAIAHLEAIIRFFDTRLPGYKTAKGYGRAPER